MAFPTTGVLDDFNRADANTLGANWTKNAWGLGSGTDTLGIAGNAAKPIASSYGEDYYSAATYGPDSEVFADYAVKVHDGGDWGLSLRMVTPGSTAADGYRVGVFQLVGTDQVKVYRGDNAVFTQLGATVNQDYTAGTDKLGFEASGTTLNLYRHDGGSWALVDSRSDGTYTSAGSIAAYLFDTSAAARLDNFGGGTVAAASAAAVMGRTFQAIPFMR